MNKLILGGIFFLSLVAIIVVVVVVGSSKSIPITTSPATTSPATIPNTTKPNTTSPPVPSDYQLYGKYVNTKGNTRVQHIAYVPSINQNVFMAITIEGPDRPVFLKMVSQDNKQARYLSANATDVASQIFDPSKWDTYPATNGNYKVVKLSDYELYGSGIGSSRGNSSLPVQYVVHDQILDKPLFMAIESNTLKMVSEDNKEARKTPVKPTDTPATVYNYDNWNLYDMVPAGSYQVRKNNHNSAIKS